MEQDRRCGMPEQVAWVMQVTELNVRNGQGTGYTGMYI